MEDGLQRVEDLGADAQRLGERFRPGGHHHELLEVEPILRVRSAVDHVQHRHRKRVRGGAAEPPVQRLACLGRRGFRRGERAAQDRVGAEPALRRRAVQLDQNTIERALVVGVEPGERVGDLAVHVADRLEHSLAEVHRRIAVAQLYRLVFARGRARRDDRAPEGAGREGHVDLDRGVAARVEQLTCVDAGDLAHGSVSFARS